MDKISRQRENKSKVGDEMEKFSKEELKKKLSPIEYAVTQENATERPFTGKYDDFYEKGIYVDIVSGEPLFASSDKFDAGCGWPAFSRPIPTTSIQEKEDVSLAHKRIEVRSQKADSHLGHVFNDGPKEFGGLRYCINSAALKFISYEEMDREGYGEFKQYVK